MRGNTGERRPYRQTELLYATKRSPNGGNTHGDRVPIVAQHLGQCPGHGQGGQVPRLQTSRGIRMDNQALARLEALRRQALVDPDRSHAPYSGVCLANHCRIF
jgi:hypothetical protein